MSGPRSVNLPAPDGTALTAEFTDGHVEHFPTADSVEEIVSATLARIRALEVDHGPIVALIPATNRFQWVSKSRAAELHAQGIGTIDTSDMSSQDLAALFSPGET